MSYIIILFGIMMAIIGVMIIIKPDNIINLIRDNSEYLSLHITAVVVILILGVALVKYAASSKYPLAMEVIGWISISAAIILGVIGRNKFKGLITWALGLASSSIARV
ncbi:hypothetical protein ACFL9T_19645, partial [Thermodesulfobacteriota bacterium]